MPAKSFATIHNDDDCLLDPVQSSCGNTLLEPYLFSRIFAIGHTIIGVCQMGYTLIGTDFIRSKGKRKGDGIESRAKYRNT